MAFSLMLASASQAEIDKRVNYAAGILGLNNLLDRFPRQLSGGQRQRVAMGRAIVRDPQVFLFDEPLSNLDAKLRVAMRAEIKELHHRLKTTTVYVTHDQIEAMTMADKIVVMHDGRVEQIGSPLELYDNPNNLFVAGFIGSPAMNMIKGRLDPDNPQIFVASDGTRLPLAQAYPSAVGKNLIYGLRPEYIRLEGTGYSATVAVIEPTGYETQIVVHFGGSEVTCVFRERVDVRPGEAITIAIDPVNVHLFDEESGHKIAR
jgi:multiple sugar transport system ATP-binding protein